MLWLPMRRPCLAIPCFGSRIGERLLLQRGRVIERDHVALAHGRRQLRILIRIEVDRLHHHKVVPAAAALVSIVWGGVLRRLGPSIRMIQALNCTTLPELQHLRAHNMLPKLKRPAQHLDLGDAQVRQWNGFRILHRSEGRTR